MYSVIDRLLAVGHAVLPQVPLAEIRRHHPEVAAAVDLRLLPWRRTAAKTLTTAARNAARQDASAGDARVVAGAPRPTPGPSHCASENPCQVFSAGGCFARSKFSSRVCVPASNSSFSVSIVLPRDAQPAGLPHDPADAERLALVAARVVGRKVPALRHLAPFGADRNAGDVALRWRHHAPAPVLGDDGDPGAGEIDRRSLTCRLRRTGLPAAAPLTRGIDGRKTDGEAQRDRPDTQEHASSSRAPLRGRTLVDPLISR